MNIKLNFLNEKKIIEDILLNKKNNMDEPFYVVNLDKCFQRYKLWIECLPRIKPYYAIKANSDHMMVKLYSYLGTGFDCASKDEINQILQLGVSPDRIIYANTIKDSSSLEYAYKMGVNRMTFDNEIELYKIKKHHPNANVLLRIKPDDSNAVWSLSEKFGADLKSSHKLIELSKELNINLIGIAFHMGSSNKDPNFREEMRKARDLFDFSREKFGIEMYMLDIGGSYPGLESENDLFKNITENIKSGLEEYFPSNLLHTLNNINKELVIIAEPGRFLCESVLTLCTKIIGKNVIEENIEYNENYQTNSNESFDYSKSIMYYLNCGRYSGFMFLDPKNMPIQLKENNSKKLFLSTFWGPTCDSLDVIIKKEFLPEYNVDDYLIFENMGTYSNSIVTYFNSFPVPYFVYAAFDMFDEYSQAFK